MPLTQRFAPGGVVFLRLDCQPPPVEAGPAVKVERYGRGALAGGVTPLRRRYTTI